MSTFAQFRTAVSGRLGLDNSAAEDQPQIDTAINEGVVDVMLRTRCKVSSGTFSLTAGGGDYDLDSGILRMLDLFDSDSRPLEHVSPQEIIDRRVSSSVTQTPTRLYALHGSDLLMVYPTPDAADELTTYYIPRPDNLVDPDDEPTDIPREFHKAVEYYALWQLADTNDDATSSQGLRYEQDYEKELAKARVAINRKGGRPPRIKVGRRGYRSSDRSADVGAW